MVDEFPQAQVPGEGGRQEQAGIGHQVGDAPNGVGPALARPRHQHVAGAGQALLSDRLLRSPLQLSLSSPFSRLSCPTSC